MVKLYFFNDRNSNIKIPDVWNFGHVYLGTPHGKQKPTQKVNNTFASVVFFFFLSIITAYFNVIRGSKGMQHAFSPECSEE